MTGKRKKRAAPPTHILEYSLDDVFGDDGPSFTSQSLSEDTRRTHEKRHVLELPSPMKKQWREALFPDVGDDFEYVFEDLAAPPLVNPSDTPKKTRAKCYLSSVSSLRWLYLFSIFNNEIFLRIQHYNNSSLLSINISLSF
jgi:hypothetical protein